MIKKMLILSMILLLGGCASTTPTETTLAVRESVCKDTPLSETCFIPSEELNHVSPTPEEYLIEETFETESLNQLPSNWLLYSNAEYKAGGVSAKVLENGENRYVEMTSDGSKKPPYPQGAQPPTFIFTTKFNLDIARKGIASIDVMIPLTGSNPVTIGVATGAVNTISVTIDDSDMGLFVKVGGPFYYYSLNNDGGTRYETAYTLERETWYTFLFEWDASLNELKAFMMIGETQTLLYSGPFHLSSRFNANPEGVIMVPNVVRVTMPYYGMVKIGKGYIDNVFVTRKGE